MMKKPAFFVLVCWLVWGAAAGGEDIRVVKTGALKSTVDLSGLRVPAGAAGETFKQTLAQDLVRSGWFTVAGASGGVLTLTGAGESQGDVFSARCDLRNAVTGEIYFSGKRYQDQAGKAGALAHALADDIVWAVKGVHGIASTRIVMVGSHGTQKDVYACDADGGNVMRITSKGAVCISPDWGPAGESIIYTSFHGGFPDVYQIDLQSRVQTRIVNFPGLNSGADASPDGGRIVLTLSKDGNPDLYIMDLRSKALTRLTRTRHAAEASPSWSPDGRRVVYVSDKSRSPQLYIIDVAAQVGELITLRGSENVAPDWGSDGRIVYSSRREGRYEICVYDTASRQHSQLTSGGADFEDPSWAPDARHIVCSRTASYQSDLYILDTLGDPPVRLTNFKGDWYSPAWSPPKRPATRMGRWGWGR